MMPMACSCRSFSLVRAALHSAKTSLGFGASISRDDPDQAILHLNVHGKGGKVRYLPLHPVAAGRIHQYLKSEGIIWRTGSWGCLCRRGKLAAIGQRP
jgi:hypothetical protein